LDYLSAKAMLTIQEELANRFVWDGPHPVHTSAVESLLDDAGMTGIRIHSASSFSVKRGIQIEAS